MAINGEAIYATRPWTVFGEGPDPRMGDRDRRSPYGPANFRFTVSKDGRTLYVLQMGAPEPGDEIVLESFAAGGPGGELEIEDVALVGGEAPLVWSRDESGLKITAPAEAPDELAVVYRVTLGQ